MRLREAVCVVSRDDGAFEDRGMRDEHALHFDRRYPNTARFDHVVAASGVEEIARVVLHVLVAGADPFPLEDAFGGLVLVPIKGHGGVSTDYEIPEIAVRNAVSRFVDEAQFVARDGETGGPCAAC